MEVVEMTDLLRVVVDEKYTVIQSADGRTRAQRYDKEWRQCTGDGLILAMAYKIEELREQVRAATDGQ